MKRKSFLKKATNSFVGRVLRRLLGEENGAVMMEYIVVGLLIAAACVVAVSAFGTTITSMFGSIATSMTGDHKTAITQQNKAKRDSINNFGEANAHNQTKHSDTPAEETGTDLAGFGTE